MKRTQVFRGGKLAADYKKKEIKDESKEAKKVKDESKKQ
jgi:hypothetical protein